MRNRVLTAALLAALSAPAFAQDAAEEESGPFSFNIGVVSDYAFRGVAVPPGRHRVEMRFRSRPTELGLLLSAAGLALVLALALVRRRA